MYLELVHNFNIHTDMQFIAMACAVVMGCGVYVGGYLKPAVEVILHRGGYHALNQKDIKIVLGGSKRVRHALNCLLLFVCLITLLVQLMKISF